ncbi:hypothetical protein O6H91_18G080500 [Diphasiastrum complanatum]|uniref:Uncharacterized protein n=1 Tax=Diphasiastrum complanatum TaxID=34168 RepID=A0ACC2B301_DIPCM|nr:hypothetical protein O6H91_18G080500 [Diphasiastrum complanatum]
MADAILSVPESSPPKPVQEDNEIPSHEILASIPKITVLSNLREELLNTVQKLKKDLQDWRGQLDSQVNTYRQELGELRNTLNTGVEHLKHGAEGVRTTTAETETCRETEI